MRYLSETGTWIIAGIGSIYAFATGYMDQTLQILLCFMIIDITSGILKGVQQRRLKSAIMSLGIIKKGAILLSIVFASLLDLLLNKGQPVFTTMMTWLAIGNEGLSIIENLTVMGVKIPKSITEKLWQFKDNAERVQDQKDHL